VFVQAIKYLLSIPEIKREANAINVIGCTPLDVLEACNICPRDFKCFEIQNILKEAGIKSSMDKNSSVPEAPSSTNADGAQRGQSRFRRWWGCVCLSVSKRWKHQGNWMEETRGTLMVVATVIATMAFQAGISPPGGVWQQNISNSIEGFNCNQDNICEAGTAVLSYFYPNTYVWFLGFNTTSFFASLCVILLVVIGFPLRSKLFIWLLTSTMTISLVSMTFTFAKAVVLVTPNHILNRLIKSLGMKFVYIWEGMFLIAGVIFIIGLIYWMVKKLIHIIPLLYWTVKKLCTFIRKSTMGPAENPGNV
jgi:hypothetical protein